MVEVIIQIVELKEGALARYFAPDGLVFRRWSWTTHFRWFVSAAWFAGPLNAARIIYWIDSALVKVDIPVFMDVMYMYMLVSLADLVRNMSMKLMSIVTDG